MDSINKRFPIYGRLLRLYPAGYQQEYGEQILQTLADMLDDPNRSAALVWAHTTLEFLPSVCKQQLLYTGDAMTMTPSYLMRNAIIGAYMVAPFFLLLVANQLLGQRLHNTIIWHNNVLFAWLVVLPSVAVALNLAAWIRFVQQRRKQTGSTVWRALLDIRRSWPALALIATGLGILALVFLHDSVHCITGNPIRELHDPHATIRCIQQG